jgi:undecaprenyl-diphosphatase
LGIAYLHHEPPAIDVRQFSFLIALTILAVGGFHIVRDHASDTARYTVRTEIRTMTLADWWKEGWAELPARRVDLAGEFEEPFTVQWVGDLDRLKSELMPHQWRAPVAWSRRSGFAWLNPHADVADLPVTPRLETGQREALTLVQLGNLPTTRTVLRVWRSDVNLTDGWGTVQPLWIATVVEERVETLGGFMTVTRTESGINSPRDRVAASLGIWRSARRVGETNLPSWDGSVLLAYDPRLSLPTSK